MAVVAVVVVVAVVAAFVAVVAVVVAVVADASRSLVKSFQKDVENFCLFRIDRFFVFGGHDK